jgi:CheY-like chemotaxis protein
LVGAMGGEIGVDSMPGVSSCFWFEIPLELGDPAAAKAAAGRKLPIVPPRRILLAEDVQLNQEILTEMLTRHGHDVVVAGNGHEALQQVTAEYFDLVLMDVQMPLMDGLDATRRIRQLSPPASEVPVIALTANVMVSERERYLAAGMNETLIKPIDWPQLFEVLARYGGKSEETAHVDTVSNVELREESAVIPQAIEAQKSQESATHVQTQETVPLLERAMIEQLGARLPAQLYADFLRRGISNAQCSSERLTSSWVSANEVSREAHRLKGASGIFGLKRISTIAGEIEAATRDNGEVAELLERLAVTVTATREEMKRCGLVPD